MWELAQAASIGARDEQQDRSTVLADDDHARCLLVVADGMGGHAGGAWAAQTVVDSARAAWAGATLPLAEPDGFLETLCRDAHDAVGRGAATSGRPPPGSTAVFVYLDEQRAHWCHVGDSRLYLFRDGRLFQRTRDDSLVQLLVDLGEATEEEMAQHPAQNRLLRSLGGGDAAPEPSLGRAAIQAGDGLLLCTDGAWETLATAEMAAALAEPDLEAAAQDLVDLAAARGGPRGDNVTVVLARQRARSGP